MDVKSETMSPDFIRQVAEALFNEQLAANWRFYVLVGGVTLLANIAWHMFTPYLKKRGETLATKADLDEILRQVALTTRVTEEVRANVSQADWVAREWRTVRRTKLEELVLKANTLDGWAEEAIDKWFYDGAQSIYHFPSDDLDALATLYFPELIIAVNDVNQAFLELYKNVIHHRDDILKVNHEPEDSPARIKAYTRFYTAHDLLYSKAIDSLGTLKSQAGKTMASLAKV